MNNDNLSFITGMLVVGLAIIGLIALAAFDLADKNHKQIKKFQTQLNQALEAER
jgi:Flp pilus assembly protein TadB